MVRAVRLERVTTIADLNAMLQAEAAKDLLDCDDVSCAAEIGGAVGADRILAGSIGRIGNLRHQRAAQGK